MAGNNTSIPKPWYVILWSLGCWGPILNIINIWSGQLPSKSDSDMQSVSSFNFPKGFVLFSEAGKWMMTICAEWANSPDQTSRRAQTFCSSFVFNCWRAYGIMPCLQSVTGISDLGSATAPCTGILPFHALQNEQECPKLPILLKLVQILI